MEVTGVNESGTFDFKVEEEVVNVEENPGFGIDKDGA